MRDEQDSVGSSVGCGFEVEGSSQPIGKQAHEEQAEAGSLPGRLGCEERFSCTDTHFFWNRGASIRDPEQDPVDRPFHGTLDILTRQTRVDSVSHERHQRLDEGFRGCMNLDPGCLGSARQSIRKPLAKFHQHLIHRDGMWLIPGLGL